MSEIPMYPDEDDPDRSSNIEVVRKAWRDAEKLAELTRAEIERRTAWFNEQTAKDSARIAELEEESADLATLLGKQNSRIAELETALESNAAAGQRALVLQGYDRDRLETRIAQAVAELEGHVLPLCSEESDIKHAVKQTLAALKGET